MTPPTYIMFPLATAQILTSCCFQKGAGYIFPEYYDRIKGTEGINFNPSVPFIQQILRAET
jgi:hypothetical protein